MTITKRISSKFMRRFCEARKITWRSLPVPVCRRIGRFERRIFEVFLMPLGDRQLECDLLIGKWERREIHAPDVEANKRDHVRHSAPSLGPQNGLTRQWDTTIRSITKRMAVHFANQMKGCSLRAWKNVAKTARLAYSGTNGTTETLDISGWGKWR